MRVISIANQKGGCGKTTTAINLASALGLNGKKTLLIDLDPQAHATLGLNINSDNSLYNVISKLTPRKLKIDNIITYVETNFDIVPSNILVGTLEQELADEIGRELKLTEIIAPLKERYDYILIDCPPSLGFLTVNSIRASDEIIMPVETSRFSMQGVGHLMDITNLIRDRLNHPVKSRILVTMFDSRLRHSFSMLDKFKEQFDGMLINTIVHINVKLKESAVMGKPVAAYDKYCRGSKDYYSLAKEVIFDEKASASQEEQQPKKRQNVKAEKKKEAAAVQEKVLEAKAEEKKKEEQPVAKSAELSDEMKEAIKKEAEKLFATTFRLKAPDAQSVYITGNFNDWSLDEACRMKAEGEEWVAQIPLRAGVYKYQFIIDGKWQEDPNNPRQERNSFGDINSLIEVSADA